MKTAASLKRRFGQRIQSLRKAKGLTQEGLAEAVGRSVDTISNIERGFSSTRLETAAQLAQTLGVSLPELFDFPETSPQATSRAERQAMERLINRLRQCPPDRLPSLAKIIDQALELTRK